MRIRHPAVILSVATALAQGVFEELMSREPDDVLFNAVADEEEYPLDEALDEDVLAKLGGGGNYRAIYSISPDTPAAGLARVDVRVTGNNRTVRLSGFKRTL